MKRNQWEQIQLTIPRELFRKNFVEEIKKDKLIHMESDSFMGILREDDSFYFYQPPGYRNSWVTVLEGELVGQTIFYRYTKLPYVVAFTVILQVILFLFFISSLLASGGPGQFPGSGVLFLLLAAALALPLFIKREEAKQALKKKLLEICWLEGVEPL